jgi:hypothetical protein
MLVDIRTVLLGLAFVVASFAVALAEPATGERPNFAERFADARPIRVVLPAPWEPSSKPVLTVVRTPEK